MKNLSQIETIVDKIKLCNAALDIVNGYDYEVEVVLKPTDTCFSKPPQVTIHDNNVYLVKLDKLDIKGSLRFQVKQLLKELQELSNEEI